MAQNASDSQKVDYLWKKIVYGAAKTDISGNIDATNEPNPSPLLIRGDKILQQASSIANVIPGSNSSVVTVYPTTFPVECISTAAIPTPTLTWQTGQTFWVPPEFGSTYQIKVYISPSGQAGNVLTKGTQVFATGTTNNDLWVFDYQAGILNFNSNNTPYNASNQPISFTGNSVYISGAVYSGTFGLPAAVSIGNLTVSNTTISTSFLNANIYISPTGNGTVQFGGNLAVGLPSGNIAQRPTNPNIGYARYNTETQEFEFFNGTNWVAPGTATITSDIITPDGVGNTFALSSTASTTGVMVSINGTMQQPFTAYNVSNTSIIFTEIPLSSDIVEVRHIVVGAATVSAESLILGDTSVILDTGGNVNVTGNLVVSGNYFYANGRSIFTQDSTYFTNTAVVTTNATLIDSVAQSGNTLVEWTLTGTDNVAGKYKSSRVTVLNDTGANVYYSEYNVLLSTANAAVATFTSNVTAGNINLWAVGASGNVYVAYERTILGTATRYGYRTAGPPGAVGAQGPAGTIGNTSSIIQTSNGTASTSTTTGALQIAGGAGIAGNLNVGGSYNTIGGHLIPTSNVAFDLGTPALRFRTGYFSATTIDLGGSTIGVDPTNGFSFTPAGSVTPVYMMSNGAMTSNTLMASTVTIPSLINAATAASGALVVAGGVGISKDLNLGGELLLSSGLYAGGTKGVEGYLLQTTGTGVQWTRADQILNGGSNIRVTSSYVNIAMVSSNIASFTTSGLRLTGNLIAANVTGTLTTTNQPYVTTLSGVTSVGLNSSTTVTGTLQTAVQPYITAVGILSNLNVTGVANITSVTNATSATTGALVISGGVGIAKDLWVTGNIYAGNLVGVIANVITVQNPLLYLAPTNPYPYNYDIGFYSHYVGGPASANAYVHTAFVRNNTDETWYLISNIGEPALGHVDVADVNRVFDPLVTGSHTVYGNVSPSANVTYDLGSPNFRWKQLHANVASFGNLGTTTFTATSANITNAYINTLTVIGGATSLSITGNINNTLGNINTYGLGVGTTASGVQGEIRATNNITAYYSDERLKTRLGAIENALDKVDQISGFYHEANELAESLGYKKVREVGVSAQEIQRVLPEIVVPAPIDDKYLTVRYERLTPLLIEAIKELRQEVNEIKRRLEDK